MRARLRGFARRSGLPDPGGRRVVLRAGGPGAADTTAPGVRVNLAGVRNAIKKRRLLVRSVPRGVPDRARHAAEEGPATGHPATGLAGEHAQDGKAEAQQGADAQDQAPPVRARPGHGARDRRCGQYPQGRQARPHQAALALFVLGAGRTLDRLGLVVLRGCRPSRPRCSPSRPRGARAGTGRAWRTGPRRSRSVPSGPPYVRYLARPSGQSSRFSGGSPSSSRLISSWAFSTSRSAMGIALPGGPEKGRSCCSRGLR